jgi:hypothetical protein
MQPPKNHTNKKISQPKVAHLQKEILKLIAELRKRDLTIQQLKKRRCLSQTITAINLN